jgi:conjugative transfer pilus assembly protein TraH
MKLMLNKSIQTRTYRMVLSLAIGLFAVAAKAGMQDEMNKMMNQLSDPSGAVMGNATAPGTYESATRGIISGGGVTVKTNVKSVVPWRVQPYSVTAGCGGIDIYGGYMSLINADQFVEMLRAIGQNGLGYAFHLALSSTCGSCNEMLKSLSSKINSLAGGLANSCKSAQYLVDGMRDGTLKEDLADLGTQAGYLPDKVSQFFTVGGETETEVAKNADPAKVTEHIYGNLVWRMLNDLDIKTVYGNDNNFLQALMSLYGTVVVDEEPTETADGDVAKPTPKEALISVKDLLRATGDPNEIKLYKCVDGTGADECLEIGVQDVTLKGLATLVQHTWVGPDGMGGLLEKWATGTGGRTFEEEGLVALTMPMSGFVQQILRVDRELARRFIMESSEIIALDYIENLIRGLNRQIKGAMMEYEHPNINVLREHLNVRFVELNEELLRLRKGETGAMSTDLIAMGNQYLTLLRPVDLGEDVPLGAGR